MTEDCLIMRLLFLCFTQQAEQVSGAQHYKGEIPITDDMDSLTLCVAAAFLLFSIGRPPKAESKHGAAATARTVQVVGLNLRSSMTSYPGMFSRILAVRSEATCPADAALFLQCHSLCFSARVC